MCLNATADGSSVRQKDRTRSQLYFVIVEGTCPSIHYLYKCSRCSYFWRDEEMSFTREHGEVVESDKEHAHFFSILIHGRGRGRGATENVRSLKGQFCCKLDNVGPKANMQGHPDGQGTFAFLLLAAPASVNHPTCATNHSRTNV